MVISHSYVSVYQRVNCHQLLPKSSAKHLKMGISGELSAVNSPLPSRRPNHSVQTPPRFFFDVDYIRKFDMWLFPNNEKKHWLKPLNHTSMAKNTG